MVPAVVSLMLSAVVGSAGAASASTATPRADRTAPGTTTYTAGRYIATFADDPVATYDGYQRGYRATKPALGAKLDAQARVAQDWTSHLRSTHDDALASVGALDKKVYDYTIATNGVAANLTAKQAEKLAKVPGVVSLAKDALAHPDTTYSPQFLGLTGERGLWSQLGGPRRAGAGTVVGVIDTGIWPESDAFKGNTRIPVPASWAGVCESGPEFPATTCNDKLIGARFFVDGFGATNIAPEEYLSPRDGEGHGSHTASTAAGNSGSKVVIDGKFLGRASGMAPGAKIATYKVCWTGAPGVATGCFNSDSVAAIDQAVADGVDVLNYSIGGSSESSIFDPVEQAFRRAANAGIFVAASAGNSGPGASTLDHPSPWLTTVAAATFRRAFQAVQLGDGTRYVGASTTGPLTTPAALVTSTSVKDAAATDNDARLCAPGSLDPAKVAGKVVQCDRGVIARIDKGFEVSRAGGVGMVLTNTSPNSLNGDYHPVPAVHLSDTDGAVVKAYIASAGTAATASIVPLTAAELAAAPQVPEITTFSSRGPSTTTGGDILKPDIAAPGNDVVAAVAPPFNHGRSWDFYSGTSMSSPHIAGIGALLIAKHPDWSPADIKSAMMTSARDTVSTAGDPFAQGAGFVVPTKAADPGLVYPATATEWRQYMVGQGALFGPPFDTLTGISGTDLNQASIAAGSLAGARTVTRTVRNVSRFPAYYRSSATLPGYTVTVSPSALAIKPGESKSFTVTMTRTTAPIGDWSKGSLTWTNWRHAVRIPITVNSVAIQAPAEVHAAAIADGSTPITVTPGASGTLTTTVSGLTPANVTSATVDTGPFDAANPAAGPGVTLQSVSVPAGTAVARFTLDALDAAADLDLFVYQGGALVGVSATGSGDEEVTIMAPAAGTYDVYVNGFTTPAGGEPYSLYDFEVPGTDAANLTITPNPTPVVGGTPTTLTATWTGLDALKRYLGVVSYSGATETTLVSIG